MILFLLKIFVTIITLAYSVEMESIVENIYSSHVYKIPQEKQEETIYSEYVRCLTQMFSLNYTLDMITINGKCPISWDKIYCWPETLPGVVVSINCPNYVDRFRINGTVTKICMENGQWFRKDNISWTNYSDCTRTSDSTAFKQFNNVYQMGLVGYGISLFSLVIAIVILCSFKRLRCDRNYIHLNLFVAFLFRSIFYYPTQSNPSEIFRCRLLRVINNYFIQASYQSIFTEALYMHNMIFFHPFGSPTSFMYTYVYIVICWVVPGIVIGIWSVLRFLYNNVYCWDLSIDDWRRDFWFLNSYVIFLTLANCVLFIHLTSSLWSKMSSQVSVEREKYKKLARSIGILMVVFGVYNVIWIPIEIICAIADNTIAGKTELIKLYFHHLINSCQGFLVSLLLCFMNGEVHREISSFFNKRCFSRSRFQNSTTYAVSNLRSRRSQMYDSIPADKTSKKICL